jgi:hypothetical protein
VVKKRIDIACTLEGSGAVADRLADWRSLLGYVTQREPVDDGLRLVLADDAPVGRIAELAAAEQACCAFFAFALTVDDRGTALEVRAPAEAGELLTSLFGVSNH